MRLFNLAIIVSMLLSCLEPVFVEAASAKKTGVYSDMHLNRKTGDVLGIEIIIVYSAKGYIVIFQSSEGEPSAPIIANASIRGNDIEFTLPDFPGYSGTFKGKIERSELSGYFVNGQVNYKGERIIKLRRGKSYWQ